MSAAIEKKRDQMIRIAKIHGFSSTQVLKCSQELDRMIHLYHLKAKNRGKGPTEHLVLFEERWGCLKKAQ